MSPGCPDSARTTFQSRRQDIPSSAFKTSSSFTLRGRCSDVTIKKPYEWSTNTAPEKKPAELDEENANRFSVCFQDPVCNDVMLADKKVVGGALRLTRKSILYQGTIQLSDQINRATLKANLKSIFEGTI
jgi:hypothetical protein